MQPPPNRTARPAPGGRDALSAQEPAYHGGNAYVDRASQIRSLLGLLWRGKWILLIVLLLVVGATAAYVYSLPPEYQTSSLLLVETEQGSIMQGLNTDLEESLGMQDRTLANEMLVLRQSEDIARRVAERLVETPRVPATGERLSITRTASGQAATADRVAGRLPGYFRVYPAGRDVDAINIVGTSTVPGEAALIANVVAEEYIARNQEASRARIQASRGFLERQRDTMQTALQSLEDDVKNYMTETGAIALNEEGSRTVGQIAELEAMRDEAQIELDMRQAALAEQQQQIDEIEPKLVERAASNVEQELRNVQTQLADLEFQAEQYYVENPSLRGNEDRLPELAKLKQQIQRLRTRAEDLSVRYVEETLAAGGIDPTSGGGGEGGGGGRGLPYVVQQRAEAARMRIEISGLEARIAALNSRLGEYQDKLQEIPDQSLQIAQMQRARQSTERLYTYIVERLQEVRIAEESEIGYATIIRHAGVPGRPVRPNRQRSLMLATFFGLLLGGGLVLLRERMDTRLHTPADLRAHGHSILGVVPDMSATVKEDFDGQDYVTVDGRTVSTRLVMLLNPMSSPAEAYRRMRVNVQFSRPDTVVQTLLLTSPEQGEGKSTTTANLAIAMAQSDRRTVIVDADLRRPRVHRILGSEREPGLSDVLFEQIPFDPEAFATGIDQLYSIPAGSSVPNPSELLGSKKMREFIDQLREDFDVVLFDTPPVLAFSDAMLLSTQCDATVVVAAADRTDSRAFDHAVETLDSVGATVIGGMLNSYTRRAGRYGGYGYGYGYKYGYDAAYRYSRGDRSTSADRPRFS